MTCQQSTTTPISPIIIVSLQKSTPFVGTQNATCSRDLVPCSSLLKVSGRFSLTLLERFKNLNLFFIGGKSFSGVDFHII